ncbi:hypothetical protein L596_022489 [Steinernema carpocapsae]|uniref:Uncharacterized protein n=1 Tax=Steinernema carpocapsae TaxID=34508 RepID=A0A4U5MLY5_STECR|nr:hypothetical protein L596_022489 [Steinernema carpocapsae]
MFTLNPTDPNPTVFCNTSQFLAKDLYQSLIDNLNLRRARQRLLVGRINQFTMQLLKLLLFVAAFLYIGAGVVSSACAFDRKTGKGECSAPRCETDKKGNTICVG